MGRALRPLLLGATAAFSALSSLPACSTVEAPADTGLRLPRPMHDDAATSGGGEDGAPAADGTPGGMSDGGAGGVDAGAGGKDAAAVHLDAMVIDGGVPDRSGTRLRAVYVVPQDGARQFNGWFDNQLQLGCGFLFATDGVERCLPAGASAYNVFGDPSCMQPAVALFVDACHPLPAYARVPQSAACHAAQEVHPVQSAMLPGMDYFKKAPNGTCTAIPLGGRELHGLDPEIAPSMFVAGERVQASASGRLGATFLLTDDGASARLGWIDTTMGNVCSDALAEDGMFRCLPASGGTHVAGKYFGDMMCMTDIAYAADTDCNLDSQFIYETFSSGCETRRKVYERGNVVPQSSAFEVNGAMCVPESVVGAGGLLFYQMGPALDAASFPLLTTRMSTAAGRLKIELQVADDGVTLPISGSWLDSMTGDSCSFAAATDGTLRCLPNGVQSSIYFSDPRCMSPLAIGARDPTCAQAVKHMRIVESDGCTSKTHVYTTSTITPSMLYLGANGSCTLVAVPEYTFIRPEAELDPATFVSGTVVTQ